MTLGTIAVVLVLAGVVTAIIWRGLLARRRAKRAGISPHCAGCAGCASCASCSSGPDNDNAADECADI